MSAATSDALDFEAVRQHLAGSFGNPYVYEPVCESTQALLVDPGLPEGAVAVADHQTAGRGRHGRVWTETSGSSVLVSVVLHPPAERRAPELSLVAALATADTIERATGLAAQIKWPNDVMLNRRKVSGIISELSGSRVVLGIGINVNQSREELPVGTAIEPGSLRTLTGTGYDRAELLGSLLLRLESTYDDWRQGGLDSVYGEVGARDFLRGRRVTVDGVQATAVQIMRDGRLEIEVDGGEARAIESGEVLFER